MATPKPPLPGESAKDYYRRITASDGVELPVVTLHEPHVLSENTKFAFTIGRTVGLAGALVWAGWMAKSQVGEVLERQDRMDAKLAQVLTKSDLAEAEMRIEARLLRRFSSRDVIASCPVLTFKGQSHKPCEILGLTDPKEQP